MPSPGAIESFGILEVSAVTNPFTLGERSCDSKVVRSPAHCPFVALGYSDEPRVDLVVEFEQSP